MPRPTRRRLSEDERREQLVQLALQLFGEASYDEVSIDAVAEAAGISKGLLYHYFRNKRDLYLAAVRRAADDLLAAVDVDPALPPALRLQAGFEAYLDYVESSPRAYTSLVRGGVGVDAQVAAIVEEARERLARLILEGLELPAPTPLQQLAVRAWLAASEETCLRWLAEAPVPRDRLVSFLLAALLSLLAASEEAPPAKAP